MCQFLHHFFSGANSQNQV